MWAMNVKVRLQGTVTSPDQGYSISQKWYEPLYRWQHHLACSLGIHELGRGLRADGWSGFYQTLRYECACGKYMWLRDHIGYSSRMRSGGHSNFPRDIEPFNVWTDG
jgi:hypothetical protein